MHLDARIRRQGRLKHRVLHSTQGASQDFLDDNYRRMILNGALWAIGMEKEIKPDLGFSFVGPFQPRKFSFKGEVKNVKSFELAGWEAPIMPNSAD